MGFISKILGTVVSIAVAVGGYYLFLQGQEEVAGATAPELGSCLNLSGASLNADHEEVDCGDAEATYKVLSTDGACDEVETNYTITLGTSEGNVADLCLGLNADEGDCFQIGSTATPDEKVVCKEAKGNPLVSKVIQVADKASADCPKSATPVRNKTRDTLVCLGANA